MSRKKARKKNKTRKAKSRRLSKNSRGTRSIAYSKLRTVSRGRRSAVASAIQQAENYYRSDQATKILGTLSAHDANSLKAKSPERYRYITLKAIGHAYSGELVDAEQACRQGLSEFQNALDFYYILACTKFSMREYDTARENAQKYLQLLDDKPDLNRMLFPLCGTKAHLSQLENILANSFREQNMLDDAIKHYEAAITADPGNQLPYLNLAQVQSHCGHVEEARRTVARGLKSCVQVQELRMLHQALENRCTVSACLIVKDEEVLLPGCLDSIRSWVDEIIIVDTGSNDKTVSIALSYGAKVFNQQWEGNFAKHRNFSIEQATSDWIFIIDADERICEEDIPHLKELINSHQHSIISINVSNNYGQNKEMTTFLPSVRLFRRSLNLSYEGIVHNRLIFPEDAPVFRSMTKLKHLVWELSPEQWRKKFERSHALSEKQLQQNPNDVLALFNLIQLLRRTGKDKPDLFSDQIIKHASKVLSLTNASDPSTRIIHLMCLNQLAWAHFYRGNLKQALTFAQNALTNKSNYLDPLLLIGHIHVQSKEYDQARTAYLSYLETQAKYDPNSEKDNIILDNADSRASALCGLGLLAEFSENLREARDYYQRAINLNPNDLDLKQKLDSLEQADVLSFASISEGSKYLEAGDFVRAEMQFQQVLKESTDRRGTIEEIAKLCMNHGRCQDAFRYYSTWLNSHPEDAIFLNGLANCYFKMKQFEQAHIYYESASALSDAPETVFRDLGLTRVKLNQNGPAIIAFRKYLEIRPDDPEIISTMADLCLKVGEFQAAMPLFEKSLRTNPHDHQAIFNLAECYLNMGHEDSARIGYRRALELNPDFEPAKKRLAQLRESAISLS